MLSVMPPCTWLVAPIAVASVLLSLMNTSLIE